jgi:hypothetical protein
MIPSSDPTLPTRSGGNPSYEWKVVALMALGMGLTGVDRFLIVPMMPVLQRDLHRWPCETAQHREQADEAQLERRAVRDRPEPNRHPRTGEVDGRNGEAHREQGSTLVHTFGPPHRKSTVSSRTCC